MPASLRPAARAVACSVAAWRERRAMRTDIPARHVLPDLAVLGIAQRRPQNATELAQARGVDERHARGAMGEEILDAVRAARDAAAPEPPPSADDLDRNLRPAITLISAWVSQLARDEAIDNALLATRGRHRGLPAWRRRCASGLGVARRPTRRWHPRTHLRACRVDIRRRRPAEAAPRIRLRPDVASGRVGASAGGSVSGPILGGQPCGIRN